MSDLADRIIARLLREYQIGEFVSFMEDEPYFRDQEPDKLAAIIREVITNAE